MKEADATKHFLSMVTLYKGNLKQIRHRLRRPLRKDVIEAIMDEAALNATALYNAKDAAEALEYTKLWTNFLGEIYKVDHRSFDAYRDIARIVRDAFSFSLAHNLPSKGTVGTIVGLLEDIFFIREEELGSDYFERTGNWPARYYNNKKKRKVRTVKSAMESYKRKKRKGEKNTHGSD